VTGQLVLFDLEQLIATIERPPELAKPEWPLTGAEKLLRALVRKGLAEEHLRSAAALVLYLDGRGGNGEDGSS
jgi:hypothetical protein